MKARFSPRRQEASSKNRRRKTEERKKFENKLEIVNKTDVDDAFFKIKIQKLL